MRIRYLGHSAFLLSSDKGSLVIDPFVSGNPLSDIDVGEISPDLILITHGHGDHMGDSLEIAGRCGSKILSTFEIGTFARSKGLDAIPAHMGGVVEFPFCGVKIFQAWHSSSFEDQAMGLPCSFVVTMDGKTVYHSGDTALFGDMRLIGEEFSLDVAMLPIGGHFTMGIDDAVRATKFLGPRMVIPMHYDTFDVIKADPRDFCRKVREETDSDCIPLGIGEEIEL